MTFWRQESLRMRVVATCPSTFPCLFPAPCLQVQAREADGPLRAAALLGTPQAEHSRAIQQQEAPGQGRGEGGKQDRSWVGPGTSPALQAEAGWFPIAGTIGVRASREPSSSWAVCTSQPCAFQQEVASSDLGGTWRKGGNHLEGKRGTPGPLLPPKENSRSQSSGCQPATACLEGKVLHYHRPLTVEWLQEGVYLSRRPSVRLRHRMLRTSGGRTLRNLHYNLLYAQLVKKTRTLGNQFYSYSSAHPFSSSSPSRRSMLLQ